MRKEDCKCIYPKPWRPGLFKGTAKVHKLKDNDTVENYLWDKSIISNEGTETFKSTKYFTTLLSPLISSECNIKNSYEFNNFVKNAKIPSACKMISFDVKSLFTNVPLDKTIKIILRKIH